MLSGSPGDLGYARMIKERAEAITVPLAQSQPEGTRIEVIGRYRVAPLEHGIILNDLRLVSILAAVGSCSWCWCSSATSRRWFSSWSPC